MAHRTWPLLLFLMISLGGVGSGRSTAANPSPEKIIFLHYWTDALSGGIDEMVSIFNQAHPQYKVRAKGFEHEAFKIGIKVMLAGGNPPDLFSYWAGARVQALVDQDYLAPIDDIWQSADLEQTFPPAVAQACTYNGHKYIVPVTQHYVAFFYNARVFAKHHITPPKTWEAFRNACKTLQQAGIIPVALGSRAKWPAQFWFDYLLLRTAGPQYRQRLMTGRAAYSDPEVKTAFKHWQGVLDQGYFHPTPNLFDWSEAAKMVFSGKAAMTLMGTWIIGLFEGQLGAVQGRDYDFFPFPVMAPDVPDVCLGPIDAIVMPKEGNVRAAKQTLAYFTENAPQMAMSKGSGALSPSMRIGAGFYSDLQQRILETISQSPNWAFNYDLATPPEVAEIGLSGFETFLSRPDDYGQLLEDIQRRVAPLFK